MHRDNFTFLLEFKKQRISKPMKTTIRKVLINFNQIQQQLRHNFNQALKTS
jgi:hypothetical protein